MEGNLLQELLYESLAREKVWGTPVDFSQAREIALQMYTFRDDVFGIYAYQGAPVTVDSIVRDAFVNGNLADLVSQASGQGMAIQYVKISWNETMQGGRYYITDLVVGVVAKPTRDFNTGPAYLIDALKAVWWYDQLISKLYMPWKSWLLLTPTQTGTYHSWTWEAVSGTWGKSAPLGQPIPEPPSIDEVKSHFINDGKVAEGLGEFAKKMLDEGYTVTLLGYRVQICYERSPHMQFGYYHYYQYRTHTRLSVDFTTQPEITELEVVRLVPLFVWGAIAIAIIIIAAYLGASAYQFLNNMSTQTETYEKWGWVQNPETGEWEYKITEQGTKTGPPEWWSYVIPIVVIGVAVVGAVLVIPPIVRAFRPEKE